MGGGGIYPLALGVVGVSPGISLNHKKVATPALYISKGTGTDGLVLGAVFIIEIVPASVSLDIGD